MEVIVEEQIKKNKHTISGSENGGFDLNFSDTSDNTMTGFCPLSTIPLYYFNYQKKNTKI